jgi:hypothetical protein
MIDFFKLDQIYNPANNNNIAGVANGTLQLYSYNLCRDNVESMNGKKRKYTESETSSDGICIVKLLILT